MPNANRPSGLSPVRYLNAAPWTGGGRVYCIPSTDSTNQYAIGDPVVVAGSADAAGVATVTVAIPGAGITGVIVSMGGTKYGSGYYDPANLNTIVIPAVKGKNFYVLVEDDPNVIFTVQEVGTGTQLAAADVGLNANLVAAANNGYISGWMLNNVGKAVTSTLDVRILGLAQTTEPNAFGAFAKWNVLINNHTYRAGVAGV